MPRSCRARTTSGKRCHSAASQTPPHSRMDSSTAALPRSLAVLESECHSGPMRSMAASMRAVEQFDDQHQHHRARQQRDLDPAAADPEGRRDHHDGADAPPGGRRPRASRRESRSTEIKVGVPDAGQAAPRSSAD